MKTALTLEAAKSYVVAYHAALGEVVDVEGCGLIEVSGAAVVRLNVTAGGAPLQWDVWSEPLMGGALYGEC